LDLRLETSFVGAAAARKMSLRWSWRIFILRFYKYAAPPALGKEMS
jgi:hypothetical protein